MSRGHTTGRAFKDELYGRSVPTGGLTENSMRRHDGEANPKLHTSPGDDPAIDGAGRSVRGWGTHGRRSNVTT